jgi:glutamyl/glutaminyl-tRNA synthetase
MKYNTRFNPTANGPLHLGHLYLCLVNQAEAHRSGGKFILRFDDTQQGWNYILGPEKVSEYKRKMLDDLAYFGVVPDLVESQVELLPKVNDWLANIFHYRPAPEQWGPAPGAYLAGSKHHFYPYTDRLTSEKVLMDLFEGITYLVRGFDLITEDCLYAHYCAMFNIWKPITIYLPRLDCGKEICKTQGNYKLIDFIRCGYSPDELINNLAHDCLVQPGWYVYNVKSEPSLSAWANEAL